MRPDVAREPATVPPEVEPPKDARGEDAAAILAGPTRAQRAWAWLRVRLRSPLALLRGFLALIAVLGVGELVVTVFLRLRYPFELEWMEGGIIDHVRIILAGEALYREPSLEFTPFIYTPFYYFVCAAFSRVLGVGFFAARLVSVLSMVASMALIASFVRKEGGQRLVAAVAVALFATTFQLSGSWMDVARVDSLFIALVLLGAYLARHGRSKPAAVACGAALFLAFFTKQTGVTLAVPVLAASIAMAWRRGLVATATFFILTGGCIMAMDRATHGWFSYYVFSVPARHDLRWESWRPLLVDVFWTPMVVPDLLALFAFFSGAVAKHGRSCAVLFAGLFAVALASSYSSIMHADGFANVLMPFHAVASLCAGLGLAHVFPAQSPPGVTPLRFAARFQAFAIFAVLVHFAVVAYDPRPVIPKRRDVAAGNTMLTNLRGCSGPLLMLGTGFYGVAAGHPAIHAHSMALTDVFKAKDQARNHRLSTEIVAAIRSKRFKTIILDSTYSFFPPEIARAIREQYANTGRLFSPADAASTWPKTGYGTRPDEVWTPR